MKLTEQERAVIDKKVKNYTCPFCGGKILHIIQPFILLCVEDKDVEDGLNINNAHPYKYLSGECQNCGYTILRRLDVLLGKRKGIELPTSTTNESVNSQEKSQTD